MNNRISQSVGAVVLAGFLVAGSPVFAAEPALGELTIGMTSAIAGQPSGTYLKTIWSTSNQFGSGHAWFESGVDGSRVFRLTYVGLNGQTISTTATSRRVEVVTSAGSFDIQALRNGGVVESVFVRPGACFNEPDNIAAATGVRASIMLGPHGAPVDHATLVQFERAQKAFQCRLGPVGSQLHSFLAQAGVSLPSSMPGLNPESSILPSATTAPGRAHTMVSQACGEAEAAYALAMAVLIVSTASLNPFGVAAGLFGAEAAAKAVEKACNV